MFIGITGEPGSGKSAYAVDYILNRKKEYKSVYVNINGFKMHDNIYALNFPNLYDILTRCKEIYDFQVSNLGNDSNDNVIDEPIVEYLLEINFIEKNPKFDEYISKKLNREKVSFLKKMYLNIFESIKKEFEYLPTLFVIDEVQNHMGAIDPNTGKELKTADPILSWWVSYHRHLFMDVLVISQQYQKIHIAYRRDIGYFVDGIASQSTLFGKLSPNLIYNKHKSSPYSEKNRAGQLKVKKRKELFEAYQSGDAVRSKSVILPWIIFSLIVSVVVLSIFYFVISSYSSSQIDDNNSTIKTTSVIKKITSDYSTSSSFSYDGLSYIKLTCIHNICSNKEHKINVYVDDLNVTVSNTNSQFLQVKKYSDSLAVVRLLASKDFINLFQGANNGKTETQGFDLLN